MKKVTALLTIILMISASASAVTVFTEDFSGVTLDPAWTPNDGDNPGGHVGLTGTGLYVMTDAWGSPGAKLQRSSPGATISSYSHSIDVVLDPFRQIPGGTDNTKTDIKFKMFGVDGFTELVLNSFGDMRMYHNDFSGGSGNIQPNTNIGYTDGDLLNLTVNYDMGTDTLNVTYSLNGGAAIPFYSGGGIDGPVGDLITDFVELEVFKWGEVPADQAFVAIDQWDLVVPEPATLSLLAVGGLFLRRKKS